MIESESCVSRFFQNVTNNASESENHNKSDLSSKTLSSPQKLSQNSNTSSNGEDLSLSQLTIEDPIKIQPYYNITPRAMPLSPHFIFEEEFSANPWAMLIATIFLCKTSAKTARRYMKMFFEEYPTPYHVLSVSPNTLEPFFENLGLRKRSIQIWKMTYQFVSSNWRRASDLCGIGKYGEDAYRIFCLGHTDLDPGDRYLKLYIDWLRRHTEFLEENGVIDSEHIIKDPTLQYYGISLREV